MKRSADEVSFTHDEEQSSNKKRNLSPSSSSSLSSGNTFATLDSLSLDTIFQFIDDDDLSSQLALYGTCVNVMTFVRNGKIFALSAILQLKKFIDEHPNVSKDSLHYRMWGLLHQFSLFNPKASIHDFSRIVNYLPDEWSEYGKNGLIEVRYAYSDEFFGGGFTYLEAAVKKVNSNDKILLKFTKFETLHGRSSEEVGSLDVSIDNTTVYNGKGITNLCLLEELTSNAEICKNMKGIELLNLLFGISMNEKKLYKERECYEERGVFSPIRFNRDDESIIDNFITQLVDLNNPNICSFLLALVSKTENLCKVKLLEEDDEGEKVEEEKETKEEELDLFEFTSLVKNNCNYVNYDEYSSYSRQHIVCELKRKDNGEVVHLFITAIIGPSYTGTYIELEMSINGNTALSFKLEEGSVDDNIAKDNLEHFVSSFKDTKKACPFALDLLEFIASKLTWAVCSCYEMDSDKAGIIFDDQPVHSLTEALEYFSEHTDDTSNDKTE